MSRALRRLCHHSVASSPRAQARNTSTANVLCTCLHERDHGVIRAVADLKALAVNDPSDDVDNHWPSGIPTSPCRGRLPRCELYRV